MHSISRRRALQWLSALGVAAGWSGFALAASCGSLASELDLSGARELGREYLASHPDDAEVKSVAKLLTVDAGRPEQIDHLRRRMHDDFAAGRIVNLSGWFMSSTEARIFAALSSCVS